ncbi:hypothetical protein SGPA1_11780 [Streptomyces misionensis JCM 4497]
MGSLCLVEALPHFEQEQRDPPGFPYIELHAWTRPRSQHGEAWARMPVLGPPQREPPRAGFDPVLQVALSCGRLADMDYHEAGGPRRTVVGVRCAVRAAVFLPRKAPSTVTACLGDDPSDRLRCMTVPHVDHIFIQLRSHARDFASQAGNRKREAGRLPLPRNRSPGRCPIGLATLQPGRAGALGPGRTRPELPSIE